MRKASKAELKAINEKLGTSRKPIRRIFVVVSKSAMAPIRNCTGRQCHHPGRHFDLPTGPVQGLATLVMSPPGA